ncbi:MAG: patatin-like phospholipase family protein [Chloroflexota bacterium]
MKPFRKNVAIAIDGGGIRGVIVTRALMKLEAALGKPVNQIFQLSAGTSTGSIISAGIGAGLSASQMYDLYVKLGASIFKKSWRSFFFPLVRYRYPQAPLAAALREALGDKQMKEFWEKDQPFDVVITAFDLLLNKTRFIKPWKKDYRDWSVVTSVLASSAVPTYFPVVEGHLVDGGVGSYANPCFLAAYEAAFCLHWDPAETTLISLGTGREQNPIKPGQPAKYWPWNWIGPTLGAFLSSADDQQVHLVKTFFESMDFRRYQVDLDLPISMDDPDSIPALSTYGDKMGDMLLQDTYDSAMSIIPEQLIPRDKIRIIY